MKRGEIWFADVGRAGDRPVLVLTAIPSLIESTQLSWLS